MYTKDKERVFKCIPLYTLYCFRGILTKFANIRKLISYEKSVLFNV